MINISPVLLAGGLMFLGRLGSKLYIDHAVSTRAKTLIAQHNIQLSKENSASYLGPIVDLKKCNAELRKEIDLLKKNVEKLTRQMIENERNCDRKMQQHQTQTIQALQKVTKFFNEVVINVQRQRK